MGDVMSVEVTPLRGFVRLARLNFLLYNVLPVGLGAAVAVRTGYDLHLGWYLLAQVFAWVVHVMTHYCNEFFDLEADRANVYHTPWTGGSRALVDGLVQPMTSLGAAFVLWSGGVLLLAAMPTWEARLLGAATLALAWFYTAPPLRLNYRGLGEVTVALILNGLWPVIAAVLLTGGIPWLLLAVLAPTAILQTVRMMVMNLGDRLSDAAVGKRTIPVMIGHDRAVAVVVAGQVAAYTLLTVFAAVGWVPWLVWLFMAATLPLSVRLAVRLRAGDMRDADPRRMTPVVFLASNHVSLIVAAALAGMLSDLLVREGATRDVLVLGGVLGAYAVLFAHRLWRALIR
jgi:1,4-dihydroxy-2-naphthoate polyprenyltransferase